MGNLTKELLSAIKTNSLEILDLSYWKWDKKSVKKLINALGTNISLKVIDFSGSKFNDKLLSQLINTLTTDRALKELNVAENEVANLTKQALTILLDTNKSFQTLNLNKTQLVLAEEKNFLKALTQSASLKNLYMAGNDLGVASSYLLKALEDNTSIEILDLSYNRLKDKNLSWFAPLLQNNRTLKKISLNQNGITVAGYEILLASLKNNKTINKITLTGNEAIDLLASQKMAAQFRPTTLGSCRYEFFRSCEQGISQMKNNPLFSQLLNKTHDLKLSTTPATLKI